MVEAAARSVSRMKRSHAITPLVVRLAQLSPRRDRQRPHEVLHVEPVRAARARALLLVQPDLFFRDVGALLERRHPAPAGVDRNDATRRTTRG